MRLRNLHRALRVSARDVGALVAALDASGAFALPPGELSIALLPARAMARLHADFLDDPTETDVITFAGDAEAGLAGEICVGPDAARAYAEKHDKSFAGELALYLAHGCLHLAGYDDREPDDRRRMRRAERRAMEIIRRAGALPPASWRAP